MNGITGIRKRNPRRKLRRGASAVEFAIVAPLFFMMVIGCIEFGRALMVQQILTNASRVGAREAITLNAVETDVIDLATDYADSISVQGVSVNVAPALATTKAGDMVTVSVSVDYNDISWLPAPWFMNGTLLTASSVMRKEGFE